MNHYLTLSNELKKDPDGVCDKYGLKLNKCEDSGLVIVNYDQILSHEYRFKPLVRCARSLVVTRDFDFVSRSFYRFFNLGELAPDGFDWNDFVSYEKLDGSLIHIFYQDDWKIFTRNSFGDGDLEGKTWRQHVEELLPYFWESKLDRRYSYTFELCTKYNRVVREYPQDRLVLLGMFNGVNELPHDEVVQYAQYNMLDLPDVHNFASKKEVEEFVADKEVNDPTYEGLVLRDVRGRRFKYKSESYVKLHRVLSNKAWTTNNLLELVFSNTFNEELDEIGCYLPDLTNKVESLRARLMGICEEVLRLYKQHRHLGRKEYAMIVKETPYSHLLFQAYSAGVETVEDVYGLLNPQNSSYLVQ